MLENLKNWVLLNPFILVVVATVILNFLSGVVKNLKSFEKQKFVSGLFDVVQRLLAILLAILSHLLFNAFQVEFLTEAYKWAFLIIIGIIIAYHANSILVNVAHVFGFKDLVLLKNLDDYLKSLMGRSIEVK